MLIPDSEAFFLVNLYSNFAAELSAYQLYCVNKLGKSKNDYRKAFSQLKRAFDGLFHHSERNTGKQKWCNVNAINLIEEIHLLLDQEPFLDEHIVKIGEMLSVFKAEHERKFQIDVLSLRLRSDAKIHYPDELVELTYELMKSEEYESAVLAAFKFIDSHLQTTIGCDPHEYYGEKLINYAFSTEKGKLLFSHHTSEQSGIRNFFSGANAIFRNPLAHRLIYLDEKTARAIIAMIAMMTDLITKIHKENDLGEENITFY